MATVGHIAAGIALSRTGRLGRDPLVIAAVVIAATLPDLDLLIGTNHRGPSHSLGVALIVAGVTYAAFRLLGHPQAPIVALLAAAAVGSHIVLDLLTAHSPVMALWPLSRREFVLPVILLPSIPLDDRLRTAAGLVLAAAELTWSALLILATSRMKQRGPAAR